MSFASHIQHHRESAIGEFLRRRFPHTAALTKRSNRQLRSSDTCFPLVPDNPYRTLERAIYYRIGYGFADTTLRNLHAWIVASHAAWRVWDISLIDFSEIFERFFHCFESTLSVFQPAGQRLDVASELILARYCFVLGLIEEIFYLRSYKSCPFLRPISKQSVNELLAIPHKEWIEDISSILAHFYDR